MVVVNTTKPCFWYFISYNHIIFYKKLGFIFKQFAIEQDQTAMKIGTDGVLIGAWAYVDNCKKIVDIGTGTGFIALACAQRCNDAEIAAVEIEQNAYYQASTNFNNSKFDNRITPYLSDFRQWSKNYYQQFDCAVSNPPYFTNSLKPNNYARNIARHEDSLKFKDLIPCVKYILKPNGFFSVIIPFDQVSDFVKICTKNQLYLFRKTDVYSVEDKSPIRSMLSFSKDYKLPLNQNNLIIRTKDNKFSQQYFNLTKDFYLHL